MTEQYNIYRLKTEDIPGIIDLAREFGESQPEWAPFDLETAIRNVYDAIDSNGGYKVVVNGTMVAVLVLTEINHWWSNLPVLTNMLLFVDPEYRGLGFERHLLDMGKQEAERSGWEFHIDVVSRHNDKVVGKTYRYV